MNSVLLGSVNTSMGLYCDGYNITMFSLGPFSGVQAIQNYLPDREDICKN